MKHGFAFLLGLLLVVASTGAAERPRSPDDVFGDLFVAVQRGAVFPDQKTFVDCVPRQSPERILAEYAQASRRPDFDLNAFVSSHFLVPERQALAVPKGQSIEEHVTALWTLLRRDPDRPVPGSSLLPLPHPYIVPGGRFREIYYWDSYFTMLGLRESGDEPMIRSMVENFAYLIKNYGYIPNGNRSYFMSRSQPPFFSLMVDLVAEKDGEAVYASYLPVLQAELDYWSDRTAATHHLVTLPDGSTLTRYYDQRDAPRPEAFAKEEAVAGRSKQAAPELYRNLRAAAESGWDFSSRWFGDGKTLETIRTTEIVPVDLNCLLHHLETTLAKAYRVTGDKESEARLLAAAERRKVALLRYCWSGEEGYFFDYDLTAKQPTSSLTLAGVAPLFFKLATPEQAQAVKAEIEAKFLKAGGVVTTLVATGQQWDAPNGWAPLQWLTVQGLENYGFHDLAAEIARRWLNLNRRTYEHTGKMMEKYNVVDTSLEAGGGEYPSQDGFGWTNGVFLKLQKNYEKVGK